MTPWVAAWSIMLAVNGIMTVFEILTGETPYNGLMVGFCIGMLTLKRFIP